MCRESEKYRVEEERECVCERDSEGGKNTAKQLWPRCRVREIVREIASEVKSDQCAGLVQKV